MVNLSKYQKDFIKENLNKKSSRQIAKELKIDKRDLHKYIKSLENAPAAPSKVKMPPLFGNFAVKITEKQKILLQVILIFALAFLIRLIYVKQLSVTYFFAPFKGGFDDYIFDNWAQEILKGHWLGNSSIYIYRMPLYTYFLSLAYFIFGHSYWIVYILQSFIGAITCVLIYFIASILFNRTTGLIAGIISALYGIFIFYSGMLVGETLGLFLMCLSFLFLLLFQKTARRDYLFWAGLTIGLSMLLRANIMVMVPFILLWLYMIRRKGQPIFLFSGIFILLFAIAISVFPIMVRNYIVDKDIVPIAASGGINMYIGNAYGANGAFRPVEKVGTNLEEMLNNSIKIAEDASGRKLKPSAVSDYWLKETIRSIKSNNVFYLFPLIGKKFIMFWNSYEFPDIWDYYFFKIYIPILNFPLFSFLLIAPLAFVGLYLSWPKRSEISLIYVFILSYVLSLLIAFITARYKSQIVPFLIILAAYPIAQLKNLITDNKGRIGICAVILIAGIFFSNLPVQRISFETSFNSLGILLKRAGKTEDAIATYKKASDISPEYPVPYYNLGILYRDAGNKELASTYFTKALQVAPDFIQARNELEALGQN